MSARELASVLVERLLAERPGGMSRAAVILNGLGSTKYEELFVLFSSVGPLLTAAGVDFVLPEVGELVTSLDMAGCSLSITWLDDELEELWRAPVDSPAFRRDAGDAVQSGRVPGVASTHTAGQHEIDSAATTPPSGSSSELDGPTQRAVVTIRSALKAMLAVVIAGEDEWGRLDAVAGDGDHGVGMARGAHGAVDGAEASDGGPRAVLQAAADSFADRAGGSSGALWGAFLGGIAAQLPDDHAPDSSTVSAAMAAGADALQRLGGCEIDDKTMYDALRPFTDELARSVASGESLVESWRMAASVASTRALATAELMPRLGRARPLGKRSLGSPDPGAISMAACLEAVVPVLAGEAVGSGA